ncbi:NAD(P)/FAD-dependent oxidoreductase [Helicobacter bizzozeronii]|uniref:NAD(P)/FAD-dependent oxidoreductase n=1 Tax=Helicobacter bizzozeronii TaxID=56877 RepID=UPI00244D81DD|nr:FAD-dependent oxidoreductase [Helicobacter bizzozeronii]GMB92943.1 NAD(P)/FAD-dependent oxidoreductase [Helicobacter bizzozeronii]
MRLVVLGAGYASLAFLKSLSAVVRSSCQIILISESPLHYFSVLLHEVVAGMQGNYALALNQILPSEVQFIQDRVLEIQEKSVLGAQGAYDYDYLVVGLGFASESFGVAGVQEHAHSLVNFASAQASHQALLQAILDFKQTRPFSVVVCGGGFSGIELVGALSDTLGHLCAPKNYELTCIEAMPAILPMFAPQLAQKGVDYLQKRGVQLVLGAKILACQSDRVQVEQGGVHQDILADFLFWTCGVRGSEVVEHSKFLKSVRARVEVNAFLEPAEMPGRGIFVLGDCAALKDQEGKFYPPSAQLASQMGRYLGQEFSQISAHKPPKKPFAFTPKGVICSLGAHFAIGHLGRFNLAGKGAVWLKKYIEWRWKKSLTSTR